MNTEIKQLFLVILRLELSRLPQTTEWFNQPDATQKKTQNWQKLDLIQTSDVTREPPRVPISCPYNIEQPAHRTHEHCSQTQ